MAQGGVQVRLFFLFTVVVCASSSVCGQQHRILVNNNGYAREALTVSKKDFTFVTLKGRASDFLSRHRNASFARLEISVGPGALFYADKGTNHVDLKSYFLRLQKDFSTGLDAYGDICSLIKVGQSAMIRIRSNERVQIHELSPRDYPMPGSGDGFEILHLSPLYESSVLSGVEVFVRSITPRPRQDVLGLARDIRAINPRLKVRINVRTDSWFLTDPSFPFLYPFDKQGKVPTLSEYQRRWTGILIYEDEGS